MSEKGSTHVCFLFWWQAVAMRAKSGMDGILRPRSAPELATPEGVWLELTPGENTGMAFDKTGGNNGNTGGSVNNEESGIIGTSNGSTPKNGEPNSTLENYNRKGQKIGQTFYDDQGRISVQIHLNDHWNPKQHPFGNKGEHIHVFVWKDGKIVGREIRALTNEERIKYKDILGED